MVETSRLYWLIVKDVMVELRRSFEILASGGFVALSALFVGISSNFAIAPEFVVPGFWIILLFIATFATTTTFMREADRKTIIGLRLIPVSPSVVFLSKLLYTFILLLVEGLTGLGSLAFFSGQWSILRMVIVFVIFSLYLAVVASFVSAEVMYSEGKYILLPMLLLALTASVIPTVISASSSVVEFGLSSDLMLLAASTIIMLIVATLLSEYILSV